MSLGQQPPVFTDVHAVDVAHEGGSARKRRPRSAASGSQGRRACIVSLLYKVSMNISLFVNSLCLKAAMPCPKQPKQARVRHGAYDALSREAAMKR